MGLVAGIVIVAIMVVSIAVTGVVFVWAAKRDGEDDQAVQKRLGIRRKTRLGR